MSLVELFNDLQKTAGQDSNRQPDDWDRAAASHGMTTDQYLDKVAEVHVQEQVIMTKSAQASHRLGEYMAAGFWDAMSKVANSHPVRDGVPEIYIKIAQASKQGLIQNLTKIAGFLPPPSAAALEGAAPGLLGKILGYGKQQAGRAFEATGGKGGRALSEAISPAVGKEYAPMLAQEGGMPVSRILEEMSKLRRGAAGEAALRLGAPAAGIAGLGAGGAALGGAFD